MLTSTILTLGLAALATSAPLEARQSTSTNYFNVTSFVFGCTSTCDWSFEVTNNGTGTNHPSVVHPVKCSGSLTDTDFVTCSPIGTTNTRSISAYITKQNQLRLQYHVEKPNAGAYYDYFGHRHVNAATSGKPQADEFLVKEVRATGVA